jgi:hypothetical protein
VSAPPTGGAAAVALLRLRGRTGDSFRRAFAEALREHVGKFDSASRAAKSLGVRPDTLSALCLLVDVELPRGKSGPKPKVRTE